MTTKTCKAVRAVGNVYHMFNDRLKDGRRSLKVWGWQQHHYLQAKKLLESWGCKVEIVELMKSANDPNNSRLIHRLHVTE